MVQGGIYYYVQIKIKVVRNSTGLTFRFQRPKSLWQMSRKHYLAKVHRLWGSCEVYLSVLFPIHSGTCQLRPPIWQAEKSNILLCHTLVRKCLDLLSRSRSYFQGDLQLVFHCTELYRTVLGSLVSIWLSGRLCILLGLTGFG